MKSKIYVGDATTTLRTLKGREIAACITSPPYWGIMDYKGGDMEIGGECNRDAYISNVVGVFQSVATTLKPNGSLFVVIGDSYNSKGRIKGYSKKGLCQIPERFDIAMTDRGFIKRNTIIYEKVNARPSPVKDRFTVSHEYLYFYVLQDSYKFNSILEPYTTELNRWGGEVLVAKGKSLHDEATGQHSYRTRNLRPNPNGRNKRTVWSLCNNNKYLKGEKFAHPAIFPPELVEPCIQASTNEGDVVLDVFAGIGTTLIKAIEMDRVGIGIELNPTYAEIAQALVKKHTGVDIPIVKGNEK